VKLVNQKGKQKNSLISDAFPAIYLINLDSFIATARSNKVASNMGIISKRSRLKLVWMAKAGHWTIFLPKGFGAQLNISIFT
jgi:hypothetical protein